MLAHVTFVSCWQVSEDHTLIYEQVAYEPNLVLRYVHRCPHACQTKKQQQKNASDFGMSWIKFINYVQMADVPLSVCPGGCR